MMEVSMPTRRRRASTACSSRLTVEVMLICDFTMQSDDERVWPADLSVDDGEEHPRWTVVAQSRLSSLCRGCGGGDL